MEPGLVYDMMVKIQAVTLAANPKTKDTLEVMTWSRLLKATQEDAVMVRLAEAIERGFPDSKHNVPQDLQEYHRYGNTGTAFTPSTKSHLLQGQTRDQK